MIQNICLLTKYNLYESKRYFTHKFSEALNRHGIKTVIIDTQRVNIEVFFEIIRRENPDLICSFNSTIPYQEGLFFWDRLLIPYLSLVVDPVFYYQNLMNSAFSIISCVDRFDCELIQSQGFENTLFLPHGVEKELYAHPKQQRSYEVVLIGSSYDPDTLRSVWEQKYERNICQVIENAIEIGFSDDQIPFWKASMLALESSNIDAKDVNMDEIVYFVDHYMRGKDRVELIRSITEVPVHVFGGPCVRKEKPIQGWGHYLGDRPNVTIHPAVSFEESLEIFKRSKICLNSVPSFRNGTHERIFISLACGCLPITTENIYIRENFLDGEDLLLYQFNSRSAVNDKVEYFLNHEFERQKIVKQGREKVMQHHTWDTRVERLLEVLPSMISRIHSQK